MKISLCMYCNLNIVTKNVPVIIPVRRTLLELIYIRISHESQDLHGETPLETHSILIIVVSLCVDELKHNIINNITKNNIHSTVQRDLYVCVHKMNCIDNIDCKCYNYIFMIKVLPHIAFIYSKLTNNIVKFLLYYLFGILFFHWHDHGHTAVAIFLYLTDAFS